MTTCVLYIVLAVVNISLLLLLLVMYVLSGKLVTVTALVEVIVGDVEHCISESIHSRYNIRFKLIWYYSQIKIELLLPSPIIFSALTVMRYKVSHDTLSKDTLVLNDSVIDDVKLS